MSAAHEFYVTILGLGALGLLTICVGVAIMWALEHPHPTYRPAPDPDAVYDQYADDPDVAAWENELAGGGL